MTSNEFKSTYLGERRERLIYKEIIGKGSYGEVWRAEWRDNEGKEMMVAGKRLHQEFLKPEYGQEVIKHRIDEFRKEWETLRKLEHPNIVKLFKFGFNPPAILMELMHCDLLNYIKKSTSTPKVSPDKVVSIALGVAKGLEYLHGQEPSVVHRDLASKNILLTEDGHPKIADLGLAKVFPLGQDAAATPGAGTPLYAAPETLVVVCERAMYGPSVDIFSFGVVLMEMCIGHEPRISPMKDKFSEVKRRQSDINEMEEGNIKQLVIECLQEKSSSRPSASKLVTILEKIKDERERLKAEQVHTFERLSPNEAYDYYFKVLLLGNCNVGKTSLFELLRNPVFDIDKAVPTLKIEPAEHYFQFNEKNVKMTIIDTSGEERYFSLTSSYFRDVDGVFLVYDVSDKISLRSLPFWIQSLRKYNSNDELQMLLVGNKVDLRPTTDADELVPQEHAVEYASNIRSPYVETSARDAESVTAMYEKMVEILMSTVSPEDVDVQVKERRGTTIRLRTSANKNNSKKNKCSCKKA